MVCKQLSYRTKGAIGDMQAKIAEWFEQNHQALEALEKQLWETPELALHEFKTARVVGDFMARQGFTVTRKTIGLSSGKPNCIIARWGQGRPVVGFLADMDAFPETCNAPGPAKARRPGPGHGCGHQLVTSGDMAAACALKCAMETENVPGSIVFFGCPAEESVGAKYYMALEGLFEGVDVFYQWHPGSRQMVFGQVAVKSVLNMEFVFTSDGGRVPGALYCRKADNAAELMGTGVGYAVGSRDFPSGMDLFCRQLPKIDLDKDHQVVNAHARFSDYAVVCSAKDKLIALAKGAALMAGCDVRWKLTALSRHYNPNCALNRFTYESARKVPKPAYSADDDTFAEVLYQNFWEGQTPEWAAVADHCKDMIPVEWIPRKADGTADLIPKELDVPRGEPWLVGGGSDMAHVSFLAPTVYVSGHGCLFGIPGHTWANNVAVGSGIGVKAMKYCAAILAQAAWDVVTDDKKLAVIQAEFLERQKRVGPFTPVPLGEEGSFCGSRPVSGGK